MAIPSGRQNLVGCQLVNLTDLALTLPVQTPMGNGVTQASTNIATPNPQTWLVLCQLVSGQVTIKSSVNAGTPNYGSPDNTLVISGTVLQGFLVNSTVAKTNIGLQLVSGGSGAQFLAFSVIALNQMNSLQGWPDVTSGANAVASTIAGTGSGGITATGSGVFTINT